MGVGSMVQGLQHSSRAAIFGLDIEMHCRITLPSIGGKHPASSFAHAEAWTGSMGKLASLPAHHASCMSLGSLAQYLNYHPIAQ